MQDSTLDTTDKYTTKSFDSLPLLDQINRRVDKTLAQCDRFDELAELLEPWAAEWPTEILGEALEKADSEFVREQSLVGLALKGTSEATQIIEAYNPGEDDSVDHETFYHVALIEAEERGSRAGPSHQSKTDVPPPSAA